MSSYDRRSSDNYEMLQARQRAQQRRPKENHREDVIQEQVDKERGAEQSKMVEQ